MALPLVPGTSLGCNKNRTQLQLLLSVKITIKILEKFALIDISKYELSEYNLFGQ